MKLILCALITALMFIEVKSQELRFYTNNGATELKQGSCNLNDLTVKVPLPASAAGFDKVRFFVFVMPSRASQSQAIYHCVWEKSDLAGKKEVTVVLKGEEGGNEFYYGGYGIHYGGPVGSGAALNLDWPCKDERRAEQFWKISFELEGMKFSRFDFDGDGKKQPVYNATTLKKWNDYFPYDYGKADQNFYAADRSFSIKKVYDNVVDLTTYENEVSALMGNGRMTVKSIPASKMSAEAAKQDIMRYIRKNTLASVKSSEEPVESWSMEFCYPCLAKKVKKCGNETIDNALAAECANLADWKPVKIGGADGFVFSTSRGFKSSSNGWDSENSKPRVSDDERLGWQSALVFVVENKGKVFVGVGYNTSDYKSPDYLLKFYTDVMQSFQLY